jgi:hypothetical protein
MSASARAVTLRSGGVDAAIGAVHPDPILGLLMQTTTACAFVGTVVAYRRRGRDSSFDPFPIVTRWSVAGFALGAGLVLLEAIA